MFSKRAPTSHLSSFYKVAISSVLGMIINACSGGHNDKVGQVLANVDGTEITIHQLNAELGRLNIMSTADTNVTDRITSDVLHNLVDQQLLVAKAKEKDLDRTPAVVQAIELAKRQILAQAYLKQLAGSTATPDDKELTEYYNKHPELFQNRKLYTLHTFVIAKEALKPTAMDILQKKSKSLIEAESFLKSQNIPYQQNTVTHPAEDLPMKILSKMVNAPAGQIFLLDGTTQVTMYEVVTASDQPILLDEAKPIITRFLSSQSNEQRVRDELNRLRKAAKITYLGKFDVQAPNANNAPTPSDSLPNGTQLEEATSPPSSPIMDRGLSGIK